MNKTKQFMVTFGVLSCLTYIYATPVKCTAPAGHASCSASPPSFTPSGYVSDVQHSGADAATNTFSSVTYRLLVTHQCSNSTNGTYEPAGATRQERVYTCTDPAPTSSACVANITVVEYEDSHEAGNDPNGSAFPYCTFTVKWKPNVKKGC